MVDVHAPQAVFVVTAYPQHLFELGVGQRVGGVTDSAQQGCTAPFQRVFEFGVPGATAVVLQARFVGAGPGWMVYLKTTCCGVEGNGVTSVCQWQDFFTFKGVQAQLVGAAAGQGDVLFIGLEVAVPVTGSAVGTFQRKKK